MNRNQEIKEQLQNLSRTEEKREPYARYEDPFQFLLYHTKPIPIPNGTYSET